MKKIIKISAQQTLIIRMIEQGYNKTAWHGPNLKAAIRKVVAKQAAWRTRTNRKNIAEIVLHCAYWKYTIRRRIRGDKKGSFPLKGSNWFSVPVKLSEKSWREYRDLLEQEHQMLLSAVRDTQWTELVKQFDNSEQKAMSYCSGIAFHDVYHAGQIQTIKATHKK